MSKKILGFSILCLLCFSSVASARSIGGNMNPQHSWTHDYALADALATAGDFYQLGQWGAPSTDRLAPLDGQGWPAGPFGLYVHDIRPQAGTYQLRGWSATQPQIQVSGGGSLQGLVWNSTWKTFRAKVQVPTGADYLALAFAGAAKNLRLYRPGVDPLRPGFWSPAYLSFLRAHRPTVLRSMDLTQTNNNWIQTWQERQSPLGPRKRELSKSLPTDEGAITLKGERGLSWEAVFDLCNQIVSDCWINVPLLADRDYILKLAQLAHAKLRPGIRLWIENSNELWNDGFWQTHVNRALAARDQAAGARRLDYDGSKDRVAWGDRRVASRIVDISRIFSAVWQGDRSRLRPVLAYQWANPDRTRGQLAYIKAVYGSPSVYLRSLAVAPYVNLGYDQSWDSLDRPGLSKDRLLDLLGQDIQSFRRDARMDEWKSLATSYGLGLAAYEAGFDLFGPNNLAAKSQMMDDPRIKELMLSYLDGWYSRGGGTLLWYTLGADPLGHAYGAWSISKSLNDPLGLRSQAFLQTRNA